MKKDYPLQHSFLFDNSPQQIKAFDFCSVGSFSGFGPTISFLEIMRQKSEKEFKTALEKRSQSLFPLTLLLDFPTNLSPIAKSYIGIMITLIIQKACSFEIDLEVAIAP